MFSTNSSTPTGSTNPTGLYKRPHCTVVHTTICLAFCAGSLPTSGFTIFITSAVEFPSIVCPKSCMIIPNCVKWVVLPLGRASLLCVWFCGTRRSSDLSASERQRPNLTGIRFARRVNMLGSNLHLGVVGLRVYWIFTYHIAATEILL